MELFFIWKRKPVFIVRKMRGKQFCINFSIKISKDIFVRNVWKKLLKNNMKEAMFYEKLSGNRVRCKLCRHRCIISPNSFGICHVRKNFDGKLYSLVYDKIIARHIDPIEKKPLFHFLPGTETYSIATVGCNFKCDFCQNWTISQISKEGKIIGEKVTPKEIVEDAIRYNCSSISYTYTEPTIFYELTYDTSRIAKEHGLKNIYVTNGYIEEEPLKEISKYLDAANIDLKSFDEKFYKKICGADLDEVLESIKNYKKNGIWIEITTLIIPGFNDDEEQLRSIAEFIKSLGSYIPWHVTRFHPDYKMLNVNPTPVETLRKAQKIGYDVGLRFVYMGNVLEGENTYCPRCKTLLIERYGFSILKYNLKEGKCPNCKEKIEGVWG